MKNTTQNYSLTLVIKDEILQMTYSENYEKLLNRAIEIALHNIEYEDYRYLEEWKTRFEELKTNWQTENYSARTPYKPRWHDTGYMECEYSHKFLTFYFRFYEESEGYERAFCTSFISVSKIYEE